MCERVQPSAEWSLSVGLDKIYITERKTTDCLSRSCQVGRCEDVKIEIKEQDAHVTGF